MKRELDGSQGSPRFAQMELFESAPGLNERGVLEDDSQAEVISNRSGAYGFQIKVVQFPDGLWRSAPDFFGKDWGFCWPLAANAPGHPCKAYAVDAAIGVLRLHLSKQAPSPLHRKSLMDLERIQGEQREPTIPLDPK